MLLSSTAASYEEVITDFSWQIPETFNIASEICDRHALSMPLSTAVIDDAPGGQSRICTYADLRDASCKIAGGLRHLGVTKGTMVAVSLPQSAIALAVHIAVFRLGAVLIPIAGVFSGDGLLYRLTDSTAEVMVTDAAGVQKLVDAGRPEGLQTIVSIDTTPGADLNLLTLQTMGTPVLDAQPMGKDEPVIMFYTSGTTGTAKGALLAGRMLYAHLPGFQTVFDIAPMPNDVFWTPSDWAWLGALEVVYPACYFGCPVVASVSRFSLEQTYRILSEQKVSCTFLAPTVLRRMRGNPPPESMEFALRAVSTGGEALAKEVREWTHNRLRASLNDNFGLTEANHLAQGCQRLFDTPQGAIGLPVVGRNVAIVDPQGQRVARGALGEMVMDINDPIVMLGYWNKPEQTREKIHDGWFWTGDFGYQDAKGYMYFVSRGDDMLKVAGMQVAAEEVEKALISHEQVVEAGVCGIYDKQGEPSIAAFIRLSSTPAEPLFLADELRQLVRQRVAAHAYPRVIEFVRDFPMTSTGKIQRKELSRMHGSNLVAQLG